MGQIELHDRLFGHGLTGHVDTGLSWAQERALESIDAASNRMAARLSDVAGELSGVRSSLATLGWSVAGISQAVYSLESSICVRLDAQAAQLSHAVSLLDAVHEALRTPAKTQAAEHIANAGALLVQGRAKRALALADTAIALDPLNPQGFIAAAWAHVALRQYAEAREAFEEARDASSGDARCAAARQAARLAYADREAAHALGLLREVQPHAQDEQERLAVAYDASIYLAATGVEDEASEQLYAVCMADERYAEMAVVDRALADHPALVASVERAVGEWAHGHARRARVELERAGELAALAHATREQVFPERTWMQFGISGARFLLRREALLCELHELAELLASEQAEAPRSAAAIQATVVRVRGAEQRLDDCRSRVVEANAEFERAEAGGQP